MGLKIGHKTRSNLYNNFLNLSHVMGPSPARAGLKRQFCKGAAVKLDLNAIVQPAICSLIEDDDACDDGSTVTEAFKMAYQLFGEATSRGYERIRKNFNKILPSFQLPSIYMMNKMLPLKAIYCLFDIPINESEKEKEKEDLIYGAMR